MIIMFYFGLVILKDFVIIYWIGELVGFDLLFDVGILKVVV